MTRPLADWLGVKVQYRGWISTWEKLKHAQTRYLLQNLEVKPWDSTEVRKVDHLWFYYHDSDAISEHKPQRFQYFQGCGEVMKYSRSDGSIDYAIDAYSSCDLGKCIQTINRGKLRPKGAIEILQHVITSIDNRRVLTRFGDDLEYHRKMASDLLQFWQRQQEVQERYAANAHQLARGKPSIDIVAIPKTGRRSAVGFGKRES